MTHDLPLRPETILVTGLEKLGANNNFTNIDKAVPSSSSLQREFDVTATHLLDGYISANQRFISIFLSKITKHNRIQLEAIPRSFDC